jgi:transaldolase
MRKIKDLKIKLFMDGADLAPIADAVKNKKIVKGFTTNPTLMAKAGIRDYEAFAKEVLKIVTDLPVSFEVFCDDFDNMDRQARIIASWAKNAVVKIPITNTKGEGSYELIKKLSADNIALNVTAILTIEQVKKLSKVLNPKIASIVSVFAGRIADTGIDPIPVMKKCLSILKKLPKAELLWASPREILNLYQANDCGCHIITATPDIINKLSLMNKDLAQYSLETVQMFYNDATKSGFNL